MDGAKYRMKLIV